MKRSVRSIGLWTCWTRWKRSMVRDTARVFSIKIIMRIRYVLVKSTENRAGVGAGCMQNKNNIV